MCVGGGAAGDGDTHQSRLKSHSCMAGSMVEVQAASHTSQPPIDMSDSAGSVAGVPHAPCLPA